MQRRTNAEDTEVTAGLVMH